MQLLKRTAMQAPEFSRCRLLAVWVLVLACAQTGCDQFKQKRKPSNQTTASRQVFALGRLEPATGIISISAIPGERLKKLDEDIKLNQRCPANGILGKLASFDIGKTQLEALTSKLELTEKKHKHEEQMAKAQLAQAYAAHAKALAEQQQLLPQSGKLEVLQKASQLARKEHEELKKLREKDPQLMTELQLEKHANEMNLADQELLIALDRFESARGPAELAVQAAQANIDLAKMTLEQLGQGLDRMAILQEINVAKENLKRSLLLAPNRSPESIEDVLEIDCGQDCGGGNSNCYGPYTVLKIFLQEGEFITQTPIMQLGDLSEMVCVAEVYEADINEIRVGQKVTIRSPAFSGAFKDGEIDKKTKQRPGGMTGTVTEIGSLIAPPGLNNRNPLAPADRSVFEVRIKLDTQAAIEHAAERVGLQVTIEFGD